MTTETETAGAAEHAAPIARFFVAGRPRTKGHMKPQPHRRSNGKLAITLHDREELKVWMQYLIKDIRAQIGIVPVISGRKVTGVQPPWPYAGPVTVDSTFYFEREMSASARTLGICDGAPIPSHCTPYPTAIGLGDVDTLQRAVLDALKQSGLLADDSLVVDGHARKRWVPDVRDPSSAGVYCEVRPAP